MAAIFMIRARLGASRDPEMQPPGRGGRSAGKSHIMVRAMSGGVRTEAYALPGIPVFIRSGETQP
jgi:hypothetical protein